MSKFVGTTHSLNHFQNASSNWNLIRKNIDVIIQQSKIENNNDAKIPQEETPVVSEEPTAVAIQLEDTSKCNDITLIYDCSEELIKPICQPVEPFIVIHEPIEKKNIRFSLGKMVYKYRKNLKERARKAKTTYLKSS